MAGWQWRIWGEVIGSYPFGIIYFICVICGATSWQHGKLIGDEGLSLGSTQSLDNKGQ